MRTRTRITFAGLVLVAALVGGVAWATIPDDNGLYTACKLKATGTIRLIDPSGPSTSLLSRCTSYETKITWNQKGQTGPAGANGTNGTDGKDGAAGPKGADGAVGTNGVDGTNGIDGADGVDGTNGTDGKDGAAGPKGADGTVGTNGVDGTNGIDGADGTNGTDGGDGAPGAQGPTGPQGPAGAGATYTIRRTNSNGISATAFCLPGEHVTGGGAYINNATGLIANNPVDATGNAAISAEVRGWRATRSSGVDGTFAVVYVMCAS